jgi:hypothetical protein
MISIFRANCLWVFSTQILQKMTNQMLLKRPDILTEVVGELLVCFLKRLVGFKNCGGR